MKKILGIGAIIMALAVSACKKEESNDDLATMLILLSLMNANTTVCASTSIATAAPITLGTTVTGTVGTNANCFYVYADTSGTSRTFTLTPTAGGDVDLYLSVDGTTPTAPATWENRGATNTSYGWSSTYYSYLPSGPDTVSGVSTTLFRIIEVNGYSSSAGGGFTLRVN